MERRVPSVAPREDAPVLPALVAAAATAVDDSDYDPDEELRVAADDSDTETRGRARRGAGAGQGAGATWGRYSGLAALDALVAWLNPIGTREGPLRRELTKVRERMASSAGAGDAATTPAVLPSEPPVAADGAGTALQQPLESSAAERRAAEASAKAEAAAGVAAEVVAVEAALVQEARDVSRAGAQRMLRWRQLVKAACTPQARRPALLQGCFDEDVFGLPVACC